MMGFVAAPTAPSLVAPGTNYPVVPTMQSMVATPSYAPVVCAPAPVSQPTQSFVPPVPMVPTQSFVPPLAMVPMQQIVAVPSPAAQGVPGKLTQGVPNLEQIASQKSLYSQALDKQLKDATDAVAREIAMEKKMVAFNTDKNIALYGMQVEEGFNEACAATDEQATMAVLELEKAYYERQMQLNCNANNLVIEYNMNKTQGELATKQRYLQQQLAKREAALTGQYAQVARSATPAAY